jgi:hypothetical protein
MVSDPMKKDAWKDNNTMGWRPSTLPHPINNCPIIPS